MVIPFSQIELIRSRQSVSSMLQHRDWKALKEADIELIEKLNAAIDDPHKNTSSLLIEVQKVIALYRQVVAVLRDDCQQISPSNFQIDS